jgi:hypothetical protein
MATPGVTFTDYQRVAPAWLGSRISDSKVVIPGGILIAPAGLPRIDQVTFTTAAGAVTVGSAKTVVFTAPLSGAIPAGTVLDLGGGKFLSFPTGAAAAATQIIDGVVTGVALAGGETGTYLGTGKIILTGGTFLSRTLAERDAGTGYGLAVATDAQFTVLLHDVDLAMEDVAAGVQPLAGNILYENFLPGFDGLAVGLKAKLRELYTCLVGQA